MVCLFRVKTKTRASPSVHVCGTASVVRATVVVATVATFIIPRMNCQARENPRRMLLHLKEKRNADEATHRLA